MSKIFLWVATSWRANRPAGGVAAGHTASWGGLGNSLVSIHHRLPDNGILPANVYVPLKFSFEYKKGHNIKAAKGQLIKNLPPSYKKRVKSNAITMMHNGSELKDKMNLDMIIGSKLIAEVKL
jgi:hypothetical protein